MADRPDRWQVGHGEWTPCWVLDTDNAPIGEARFASDATALVDHRNATVEALEARVAELERTAGALAWLEGQARDGWDASIKEGFQSVMVTLTDVDGWGQSATSATLVEAIEAVKAKVEP